jgi:hypothetical protein
MTSEGKPALHQIGSDPRTGIIVSSEKINADMKDKKITTENTENTEKRQKTKTIETGRGG